MARKRALEAEEDISEEEQTNRLDPITAYKVLVETFKPKGESVSKAKRRKEDHGQSSDDGQKKEVEVPNFNSRHQTKDVSESDEEDDEGDVQKTHANASDTVEEEHSDDETSVERNDAIDEFKVHLEHTLTAEEIARVDKGKAKFNVHAAALGITKGKWLTNNEKIPEAESSISTYNVKQRLRNHWMNLGKHKFGDFRSEQQCQFFALCNSYRDVFHTRKASLVGKKGSSEMMDAYLLHIINHTLKTKDLITKNNEKVNKESQSCSVDLPRDQGFTRPKILILLPIRSIALRFVKRLIELAPPSQKAVVDFKQRFFDEFGVEKDDTDDKILSKPADHQLLFGGNNDDHFRIGIKFTRKSIHLYSDFLSSDIIVASPLGLITSIGEAESDKEKNVDYLSSIEILVVDFADVILMQNWSHVTTVLEHLNKMPSKQHDTDIMRVREWYLDGQSRYYRQTIVLSSYPDAAINAVCLRSCVNHSGKVKLHCQYDGVLSSVLLQVRQVYEGLRCDSITDVDDARFNFFVKQIFPRIKESLEGGIMLFVRSYFDFVRLRNFLRNESASLCLLGEYTKLSDISRSRTWFFHGKKRIMLYTERAHFYHRYRIRGIRDLIFYSLPDHANFYSEILNMMEGVENPSCTVIYSKFDNLQLERIVGTSRAQKLLASQDTMMFL